MPKRTVILCLLATLLTAPAAAQQTPDAMLAAVNEARAVAGAPFVTMNPKLNAAACRQARDLAGHALYDVATLSHRGSDGSDLGQRLRESGYSYRMAAENLAAGVGGAEDTVRRWMASDGHRRNLLAAEFSEAGAAHVGPHLSPGGNRSGPMDVWVLVLARPSGPTSEADKAKNPSDCND